MLFLYMRFSPIFKSLIILVIAGQAQVAWAEHRGRGRKSSCPANALLGGQRPLSSKVFLTEKKNGTWVATGMPAEAWKHLRNTRDLLRSLHNQIFPRRMVVREDALHAYNAARLIKAHVLITGKGGAAKTDFAEFLTDQLWVKQLHQLMTEGALIGYQTRRGLEAGREDINTKGTLLEAVYAMLDEMDKSNPGLRTLLFRIMNERKAEIGGRTLHLPIRTIVATSNATRAQLLAQFRDNGEEQSGPPFLGRFLVKMEFPTWLPYHLEQMLQVTRQERQRLLALSLSNPKVLEDSIFQSAPKIDWGFLEQISDALFAIDGNYYSAWNRMRDSLMTTTHEAVMKSYDEAKSGLNGREFPIAPSLNFDPRTMLAIPQFVKGSALIDFLLSPLANDERLAELQVRMKEGKPWFELGALSLWRTYFVAATSGSGQTLFDPRNRQLRFGTYRNEKGDVVDRDFEWEATHADTPQNQRMVRDYHDEQKRFLAALDLAWKALEKSYVDAVGVSELSLSDIDWRRNEFERTLFDANFPNAPPPAAPPKQRTGGRRSRR